MAAGSIAAGWRGDQISGLPTYGELGETVWRWRGAAGAAASVVSLRTVAVPWVATSNGIASTQTTQLKFLVALRQGWSPGRYLGGLWSRCRFMDGFSLTMLRSRL